MNLMDTVALMESIDYKDRFKAEFLQLNIRRNALAKMLAKYKEGTLPFTPKCSYALLHEQLICMENYIFILLDRAEIEGISLYEGIENGECE